MTYHSHHGITGNKSSFSPAGNSCWKIKWFVQFFNSFLVFSADLDMICGGLFSHNVNFYSFMFLHKIFTRVVCVYGGRYNFVNGVLTGLPEMRLVKKQTYTRYTRMNEKKARELHQQTGPTFFHRRK